MNAFAIRPAQAQTLAILAKKANGNLIIESTDRMEMGMQDGCFVSELKVTYANHDHEIIHEIIRADGTYPKVRS